MDERRIATATRPARMTWRRHARFLLALLAGAAAAASAPVAPIDRILLGGNLFFVIYLLLAAILAHRTGTGDLRRNGAEDDEGVGDDRSVEFAAA